LGLQRYAFFLNLQIFYKLFCKFVRRSPE